MYINPKNLEEIIKNLSYFEIEIGSSKEKTITINITEEKIIVKEKGYSFNIYERKIKNIPKFEDINIYEALNKVLEMYRGKIS